MRQTLEASRETTQNLYTNGNTSYTQFEKLAETSPAIFNADVQQTEPIHDLHTSQQALIAHETLRRLVELRNMYDTDTFPMSGYENILRESNPTDEQLHRAATEVAALALRKSVTQELGLHSAVPDNTNFYQPPSVEVASLLVDAADETQDSDIKALAEAALPAIDEAIAEPLMFKLHESFGTTTDKERASYTAVQDNANRSEDINLIHAVERNERLKQFTKEELADLDEHDDAIKYDPFKDDE